MVFTCTYF